MMQSFGASPRGNERFKLGQRRTTHTHSPTCMHHTDTHAQTHTPQTVEFSRTRKQSRLGRQEDDLDEELLLLRFSQKQRERKRHRGSTEAETARGTPH